MGQSKSEIIFGHEVIVRKKPLTESVQDILELGGPWCTLPARLSTNDWGPHPYRNIHIGFIHPPRTGPLIHPGLGPNHYPIRTSKTKTGEIQVGWGSVDSPVHNIDRAQSQYPTPNGNFTPTHP